MFFMVKLWVRNQVSDIDQTPEYLRAAMESGVTLPDGVALDIQGQSLSGDHQSELFAAYVVLRDAVAGLSHEHFHGQKTNERPDLIALQRGSAYPVDAPYNLIPTW